ncbi:MAG: carboxypeptidase regulatory-like domain-containing protein, partial [Candidatus Solibacter usitatus]|nr:carboxypeptidase regulatory-like domain-containing protein [Candidatus Solibacter usitatus]
MKRFILCILAAILLTPRAWPQASTATVSGTVRDQTGAVIPGASVTLAHKNTNVASKSATNEAGFYIFPGTYPGPYALAVEAPGMQKFEGSLVVQVQQSAVVDVTLKVGQTATEVAVLDVTPLVQTSSPALGHVLERARIEQLPINGRNLTTLLQTVPGMEGTRAYGLREGSYEISL